MMQPERVTRRARMPEMLCLVGACLWGITHTSRRRHYDITPMSFGLASHPIEFQNAGIEPCAMTDVLDVVAEYGLIEQSARSCVASMRPIAASRDR